MTELVNALENLANHQLDTWKSAAQMNAWVVIAKESKMVIEDTAESAQRIYNDSAFTKLNPQIKAAWRSIFSTLVMLSSVDSPHPSFALVRKNFDSYINKLRTNLRTVIPALSSAGKAATGYASAKSFGTWVNVAQKAIPASAALETYAQAFQRFGKLFKSGKMTWDELDGYIKEFTRNWNPRSLGDTPAVGIAANGVQHLNLYVIAYINNLMGSRLEQTPIGNRYYPSDPDSVEKYQEYNNSDKKKYVQEQRKLIANGLLNVADMFQEAAERATKYENYLVAHPEHA